MNYLMQVFLQLDRKERVFLRLGRGQSRYLPFFSHRSRKPLYFHAHSPICGWLYFNRRAVGVGGLKLTYLCQSPVALFADLPTLAHAPQP